MKQADLHVHTTASDGTDSPGEVVAQALKIGLDALGIADHDTFQGIPQALAEGMRHHLEVIPAVELSAEENGREIHLLGYLADMEDRFFLDRLLFLRGARLERVRAIIGKLNNMGFSVSSERVFQIAGQGSVGRPHVAMAMVESNLAGSVEEVFDLYIGEGKPAYVPRFKLSPSEAVRIIRQAGGVAVLAHPGLSRCDDLIPDLVNAGLQGIEVYHPSHSAEAGDHYNKICRQYGLVYTGGSDYHGAKRNKNDRRLGECTVPYDAVRLLKELAHRNREEEYKSGSRFEKS